MTDKERGNCACCNTPMTIQHVCCPTCGKQAEKCFVSLEAQKKNLKGVRRKILNNMWEALKKGNF